MSKKKIINGIAYEGVHANKYLLSKYLDFSDEVVLINQHVYDDESRSFTVEIHVSDKIIRRETRTQSILAI